MIDSVPLREVAAVFNGKTPSKAEKRSSGHPVLKIRDINELGEFRGEFDSFVDHGFAEKYSKKTVKRDDVLILNAAHNSNYVGSKMVKASSDVEGAIATGEWLLARSSTKALDQFYLWYWFQTPQTRFQIRSRVKGIHLYPRDVADLSLPLPSIREQRHIASILDKADAIRKKYTRLLMLSDGLIRSTFLDWFGDPVQNPQSLPQKQLSECARFISGATPSKQKPQYWDGIFPWVSPKDMKVDLIFDAEDHVSDLAFAETNLKRVPANMPLIVVRGMILVHTVPVALTKREVAINQDMKAVNFDEEIDPVFGFWCLKSLQEKILSEVDTAAHGTKRIDMSRLGALPIHIPGDNMQREFVDFVEKHNATRQRLVASLRNSQDLFASLAHRAFRGEL
jgi:type I restriction enzyme S subunit